jgi:hypothetical protein
VLRATCNRYVVYCHSTPIRPARPARPALGVVVVIVVIVVVIDVVIVVREDLQNNCHRDNLNICEHAWW